MEAIEKIQNFLWKLSTSGKYPGFIYLMFFGDGSGRIATRNPEESILFNFRHLDELLNFIDNYEENTPSK